MSKVIPPPVPAIKPKLESFNSFYTTLPDGTRQKPIPFPRTSFYEPLNNKKILKKFEDITEMEYTRGTKDYSNNVFDKKDNLIQICEKNFNSDHLKRCSISSTPTTPNLHSPTAFVLDPANLIYVVPNPVNSKLADVLKPMTKNYKAIANKEKHFNGNLI
ncbi:Hypothetical protein SRAE_1000270600 [Strongyloides ratti]|uniref:Uncharacterized protein n=1 Tax=Strongyloides ratti TaxID=34506 RepID=A0A090L401_STRRB|nr:Hypothetical protein SRAE_1000270600 [Strongyloides ratti]CEF64452.1 Hypothetical protein SRAE_1000270600 [Strongyloides ratti]